MTPRTNASASSVGAAGLPSPCNHEVGYIPPRVQSASEWNESIVSFIAKVEDFNVRGQRYQVNHPGHISEWKFCTQCGAPIDRQALGLLTYGQAYERYFAEKSVQDIGGSE